MALDPQLLEILACPRTRARCLLRGRGLALQPAAEAPLRDPRRHPDHADRRGRDRRRRRARAAAGQGRGRRHQADVRGVTRDRLLDTLGHVRRGRARCPSRWPAAAALGARRRRPARRATTIEQRRRARHGRQRHRRRRARRRSPARSCRCRSSVLKQLRAARRSSGERTLVFAVSFSGDTEETVEAATEAAARGAQRRGRHQRRRARPSWPRRGARRVSPCPTASRCRAPALGALAVPPLVVLEQIGLFPGAAAWVDAAVEQLARRRDQLVRPTGNPAERARPAHRPHDPAHLRRRRPRRRSPRMRWKCEVNENAKAPAFCNRVPELYHNEICGLGPARRRHPPGLHARRASATTSSTRSWPAASSSSSSLEDEVVAGIDEVRAEGEGRSPSCSTSCSSATSCRSHMADARGRRPGARSRARRHQAGAGWLSRPAGPNATSTTDP